MNHVMTKRRDVATSLSLIDNVFFFNIFLRFF